MSGLPILLLGESMIIQDIKTIKALDKFFSRHAVKFTIDDNDDINGFIEKMSEAAEGEQLTTPSEPCTIDSTEKLVDFLGELVESAEVS